MTVRRFQHAYRSLLLAVVLLAAACSGQKDEPSAPAAAPPSESDTAAAAAASQALATSPYDVLPEAVRVALDKPFSGDFDEMVKRRAIRVAVTMNRTHYFIDAGRERGLTHEWMRIFEDDLNKELKTGNLKVRVVMIPMPRDQLYPSLASGKVDMVAAMVTVTPEREKLVAFSEPTRTNVNQVVVTGPGAPPISSLDDLAGKEVFVRTGSLYHDNLVHLSTDLQKRGKPAIDIQEAPAVLEDDDILEMVNAGLTPITVVDDYLAEFWAKVFKDLSVHPNLAVRTGGTLAVAFRKENPKLREAVNATLRRNGEDKAIRRILENRYLENTKYVRNAAANAERKKFQDVVALFKKYGEKYDLDYLLMAAQGYQESTLDHSVVSPVGAIGIMQIMPATGKELKVGDIKNIEANIHAGAKFVRLMMDDYYKDEPMDRLNKALMTFAAYNAGPGRVRQLRRQTAERGLDPNVWFGNVERIASERIGRETVTYVSNIYKYYVAYRLTMELRDKRAAAKAAVQVQK